MKKTKETNKEGFELYLDYSNAHYLVTLGFILTLAGAIANIAVVSLNGGQMPVIVNEEIMEKYTTDSPIHFLTTEEGVNRAFLADRFNLKGNFVSYGDFLIVGGLLLILICNIVAVKRGREFRKWLKS